MFKNSLVVLLFTFSLIACSDGGKSNSGSEGLIGSIPDSNGEPINFVIVNSKNNKSNSSSVISTPDASGRPINVIDRS